MQASTHLLPQWHGAGSASRRLLAALLLLALSACGGNDDAGAPAAASASVVAVTITLAATHVAVGQTATVTAEARDANGVVMAGATFTWASSDSTVAAVVDGVATGVAAGAARITASTGGVTSDPVTLAVVAVPKGSVVIDRASVFFTAAGQSRQLTALAADAQGAAATAPVTWASSAPAKVSVDASGNVTALAIGSAMITASAAGIDSAPTLIVIAEPQPGALLVSDAQVVSVGAPRVVPGALPGAAAQYEVTLQGVTAPLPGTVVLAAESAPIAGKAVATRQDAAGLVVTLAVAPLPQLFRAYDIDWTIHLSAFPALPAEAVPQSLGAAWSQARFAKMHPLAAKRPLDTLSPFKPLDCEASIEPQVGEKKATLALDNKLDLIVKDTAGYSRHSLEGSATITGSASLALKAGVGAKGRCDATAQIKLPVLGWVSVIVMPAVRFGLGANVGLEILLLQGEVGVDIVFTVTMGWECGGVSPDCRALDSTSVQDHFKPKAKFPSENDMQVKVSGQFYVLAGLDASLLMGLGNAKIVEARIGPKQSFDLAFEEDQAARVDYASSYDLKLEGVVEPGSALKKAIAAVIGDDSVELTFKAGFSNPISESPKGPLSTDKARVAIAAPIVFTVDFDADTVAYKVLGYNITGVELYRRRDDEVVFTPWKAMDLIASTKATYTWTPEAADAGNYEFAAFVNTQIQPLPWLEVAPNSVQKVEVSCFTAGIHAVAPGRPRIQAASGRRAGPQATTCADTWVGTTTSGDAAYGPNQTEAQLTLKVDDRVTGQAPGQVYYYAEGTVKVNGRVDPISGCRYLPFEIQVGRDTGGPAHGDESNQFSVNYGAEPPTAGGSGIANGTQTIVCPGFTTTSTHGFPFMSAPEGVLDPGGLGWSGSNQPFYSYQFTRP